jgi:hypothetical protein
VPALDAYIERRPPAGCYHKASTRRFYISNIFSVTDASSWHQHHYRLDPGGGVPGLLAGVGGDDLLIPDPDEVAQALRASHVGEEAIAQARRDCIERALAIDDLCEIVVDQWYQAFRVYEDPRRNTGSLNQLLYLDPSITLPDRHLIYELFASPGAPGSRRAWHLLLLTARHELGHFYLLVKRWWDGLQPENLRRISSVDELPRGPAEHDIERLSSRAGSHNLITTRSVKDEDGIARTDQPNRITQTGSDIADLYWDMLGWYHTVYRRAVRPKLCEWCNKRPIPPGSSKYCTKECRDKADSKLSAERQRMRRARLKPLP